jgi:hypothetical protein
LRSEDRNQPGADAGGYAGFEDGVDHHWWDIARAAALSTVLNIGAELAIDDSDEIARAIRDGAQDTIGDDGEEIVRRQVGRAPTLTIRPGFPVRVIVTRDLILEPVREQLMTTLKLGPLADDKPVKVTVELPAAVHRDLIVYAEILGRETGQPVDEPAKLLAPTIARFMATDRGFAKARRASSKAVLTAASSTEN